MKKSIVALVLVFSSLFSFAACRKIEGDGKFVIESKAYIVDSDGVTRDVQTRVNENGETEYYYTDVNGETVPVQKNSVKTATTRVAVTDPRAATTGPNGETASQALPEQLQSIENLLNGTEDPDEAMEQLADEKVETLDIAADVVPESAIKDVEVPVSSDGKPTHNASIKTYSDILSGNTFTLKMKMRATMPKDNGTTEEVTMPITVMRSGDKYYYEMAYPVNKLYSMTIAALVGDNAYYMIIPKMRAYMSVPKEQANEMLEDASGDSLFDSEMFNNPEGTYVGSGVVTLNGKSYTVDTYENDGATIRYFFENDQLKRIETIDGDNTTIMELTSLTTTVDNSKFVLPSGYIDLATIAGEDYNPLSLL
ncbi:MAG: hypothetical protein IJK64_00760 [Clostridia bacterium]|nr:hypothetical protein [Clostridia bacterium]